MSAPDESPTDAPGASRVRRRAADALGLLLVYALLLGTVPPSLLLLPTITAGGDTPCHYPTAAWFVERLLPRLRLQGWYPGAYLGQPLLLYYFPLPFLAMAALAPVFGLPAAFKLGAFGGPFLLPLLAYAAFRLMRFRFPAPLLAAAAGAVFLFVEENPIWGGTLASAFTGEFAYGWGIGLAVLFLGVVYRAYATGASPVLPAALLALVALAHGYAVLWAGLSAAYFLYGARRPLRTLGWLLAIAGLALCLAGFWLLPLLGDWGWTTPYDDPWITVTWRGLIPPLLWPLFAAALLALAGSALLARRARGHDQRVLFIAHAALVAAALAAAAPAAGVIDVRFVPFAHLALALAGAAFLGLLFARLRLSDVAAVGAVMLALAWSDAHSKVLRFWADYNLGGLEAKELWPAWSELSQWLHGTAADPRVAVEYSTEHEKAGSIRVYETLPFFSGRSTLEGVYNQASVVTHPVYYLASELGASSPNPFRRREYSRFDTDAALGHLELFNADTVVALSPALVAALDGHPAARREREIPPYVVFRLHQRTGYAEPLAFAPVRSPRAGWRDKSYRWFTRKERGQPHLVFTDDPRFETVEADEWLPPPRVSLAAGTEVESVVEDERITLRTSRVGHPVLVKVAYHPRWRAEGADGPYLVAPGLMMVVPTASEVRLTYGRRASDVLGLALTLSSLAGLAALAVWRRRRRAEQPPAAAPVIPADACEVPTPPRRWGAAVPATLLVALAAARFVPQGEASADAGDLYDRASRAYAEARWADAAEYARHALFPARDMALHASLLSLRGESLLRAARPREALLSFQDVLGEPSSPYRAQALFGAAEAQSALGDEAGARESRARLLKEFPESPWATRVQATPAAATAVR
jgi:hypothetical protein